ncbi:hypothetical protein BLA29_013567 [Euroglyphus maynei]|uniref:Uncharacterized protein n=1 Tax=Euroglyphus maynei TaxID=6958 RepID=A0A1Y3BA50_EURMA|nr:hypothetical protein BLA29_013567 [Euroglyphus maynei]
MQKRDPTTVSTIDCEDESPKTTVKHDENSEEINATTSTAIAIGTTTEVNSSEQQLNSSEIIGNDKYANTVEPVGMVGQVD